METIDHIARGEESVTSAMLGRFCYSAMVETLLLV